MEISIRITSDNRPPYSTKTSGFANISFYNAVLGKLLKLTETLEVKPDLLKTAYWDFKKLSFIIELREDLVFHNGRKATIDDLYFSIARFFYTTARADQISILKLIEGTDNIEPDDVYKP
ncbi:MAG: hypothetical protein VX642_05430, partial [Bdellovibrionota bacterium]|nr:hypothetical protein [Bdellovibrionota bacterium]